MRLTLRILNLATTIEPPDRANGCMAGAMNRMILTVTAMAQLEREIQQDAAKSTCRGC